MFNVNIWVNEILYLVFLFSYPITENAIIAVNPGILNRVVSFVNREKKKNIRIIASMHCKSLYSLLYSDVFILINEIIPDQKSGNPINSQGNTVMPRRAISSFLIPLKTDFNPVVSIMKYKKIFFMMELLLSLLIRCS